MTVPSSTTPQRSLAAHRHAAFEHRHRPDLDGIRGVLACNVMLLHFGINRFAARVTGGAWPGFVFDLCVDVFFLLSGFVLTSSYLAASDRGFPRFAIKRFFRLVPVFYEELQAQGLALDNAPFKHPHTPVTGSPEDAWTTP